MKKVILFLTVFSFYSSLSAQCDFPRNTCSQQYQNAIKYTGQITMNYLPDGRLAFRIDPSKLGFHKNQNTGESLYATEHGKWYFKWNYAARPNRWQPVLIDCHQTSCSLQTIDGKPLRSGWIEVDFFYWDKVNHITATYEETVQFRIADGKAGGLMVLPQVSQADVRGRF